MDLSTRYLGMTLSSPIVASASPLNTQLDNIRQLEDFGAGAVVLPSIFEEQIQHEQEVLDALVNRGAETFGEALSYFPSATSYAFDSDRNIALIERAAEAVDIPVIASLNGITDHGWIDYAHDIEQAGAQAIELNIYFIPSDTGLSGRDVEQRYIDIVTAVKAAVTIPVSVKLSPYFSSPGNMAMQLDLAGADGLVLFNRFYEPDIDPSRLTLAPSLDLSRPYEMRLPLLWIGVLSGRVNASLSATTGVDSSDDVVKFLLAGADVVMTTSALLRHGLAHIQVLREGLEDWLSARELTSPDAIRGKMNRRNVSNPEAFERANYIKVLQGYSPT